MASWLRGPAKGKRKIETDPYVRLIKQYQDEKNHADNDYALWVVGEKYPGIFYAEQIYQDDDGGNNAPRWSLEARLLANEKIDEIAKKMRLDYDVIVWYERVFFNVEPYLTNTDYIIHVVLGHSINCGLNTRDHDLLWKLIGYRMGPVALDAFLHHLGEGRHVVSYDQYKSATEDHLRHEHLGKSLVAALTMPVSYNQNNILQLWNESKNIERQMGKGEGTTNLIVNNIAAAISGIGKNLSASLGTNQIDNPLLKEYDKQSVELRASDLIDVAFGNDRPEYKELSSVKFPELANHGKDVKADTK